MKSLEIEIRNPSGIHLRPAGTFVKGAAAYRSAITIENLSRGGKVVNAKDALAVLSHGKAAKGDMVRIVADGEDEEAAIEGLRALVESGLGETIE